MVSFDYRSIGDSPHRTWIFGFGRTRVKARARGKGARARVRARVRAKCLLSTYYIFLYTVIIFRID